MVAADTRQLLANCSSDRKVAPLSTLPGCGRWNCWQGRFGEPRDDLTNGAQFRRRRGISLYRPVNFGKSAFVDDADLRSKRIEYRSG
jgi:hypothetical protein